MPKPFKKKSEPPYEAEALMDVMRLFSDDFSAATKVGRTSAKTLNRSRQLTGMLQMMTDNIPDMIWAKDVGNRYLFANLSMRERLLCAESLDEVIGRTDMYFAERQRALRPGDTDWHTFGELCRDSDTIVLKSRVPHLFEESGNVRGIPLRLDVHKAPFFDAGGNLIGTVGCGRDVTEIAGLRSALRESESRFRLVLDSFPDAVVLHRDNIILYANGIAAQLAGLSDPATMIGKPIWDFVPCDLHLMFNVRIAQAKRSDRPLPMVSYRVERTGAPPLFVESVVLRIDFGGEKALLTIMRDATDRRIAENSLRESEQRSRLILDMSPHSMMLHRDGIILYANPAAAGMLGYEVPGELEGRELMEFVHPPFRNHVRDRIKRLRFVGMTLPPDIQQCITKAGDTVDIEAIATLISYQGKKTVLSIARDMTSQRALESAYKMLLNAMTEGFVLLEVLFDEDDNPYDCRYLSVNAAWERIRGKHATDVIGKTILEVHPDFPRDWIAYYGKVAQSGAPLRAKRVSGDGLKWFVITAYRTGPRQVAATIVDITDKELAHAALRASEERFRLFFEEAPVGYQALDKNGMLLDINNTWRETLGYDRDEVVGRSLREFLSPASQTIHDTAFADFLTTGEMHGLELDMQHRNGSTVPVSVEGRVAYDEHGRFKQTHCIFYNISDRKRLEEQLRQSQKMEAIGVLAGGIAHDFNNIIQAVVGNLHLLRTRVPQSSDALSFVDEILDLTQRAADLTGGLLAFSRKQILLTRVFDLNSIVKSTLSMLERLIGETIEIESYLFPKPLVVSADIGQIQQVIM
ncbi:MAG TPA: PAS domain S-box protein, partial [Dissulfurispiraceae bacterium]|nr:PAS domain S-box protein [Dissulfurispiraceae bacterium]